MRNRNFEILFNAKLCVIMRFYACTSDNAKLCNRGPKLDREALSRKKKKLALIM